MVTNENRCLGAAAIYSMFQNLKWSSSPPICHRPKDLLNHAGLQSHKVYAGLLLHHIDNTYFYLTPSIRCTQHKQEHRWPVINNFIFQLYVKAEPDTKAAFLSVPKSAESCPIAVAKPFFTKCWQHFPGHNMHGSHYYLWASWEVS